LAAGFALAEAEARRLAAEASARLAGGESGLRSGTEAATAGREASSVIENVPAAGLTGSIHVFAAQAALGL